MEDVYNLACPASPLAFQKDPISTTKTAVLGAINLLELALKSGSKIFQASTSEVYGDPEVHPQPEWYWGNVNPIGTRACYDEGKRCAESLFFDYRRIHKIEIRVARIFNTYGLYALQMMDLFMQLYNLYLRRTPQPRNRSTRSFCW